MADPYAPEINRYSTGNDRFFGISTALAIKAPVMVYASTAITLFGEQTIGAVAIVQFDRVLVGGQADPIENGIWECREKYWKRTGDFEGNRNVVNGTVILVAEPGLPVVQYYVISAAEKVLVGETPVTFAPVPVDNPTDAASTESQMEPPVNLSDLEEAIAELQFRDPGPVAEIDFPAQEIQFENASNDGELLANGGSIYSPTPALGHVPEASTRDLNKYAYGFGGPQPDWSQESRDRGKVWWDEGSSALKLRTEAPGVALDLGKQVAYRILNNSGVLLPKGTLVMSTGSFFGSIVVKKAQAISEPGVGGAGDRHKKTYTNVLGMVAEDIPWKDIGYAIAFGEVSGLDTTVDSFGAAVSSGPLYLSDTVAGGWETNPPQRRVQIGTIGHIDATQGRISVNILDQDFVTYTGVSFQITGNGGVANPTIAKEFNVAPLGAPVIAHQGALGSGTYRVTLNWYTRDWYDAAKAPGTCILDNLIENWTCKDWVTAGATAGSFLERRAYITAIDATASPNKAWFEFTYFGVQIPAIAAVPSAVTAVELQPMDMTVNDKLTFFGQLLPFKPVSG